MSMTEKELRAHRLRTHSTIEQAMSMLTSLRQEARSISDPLTVGPGLDTILELLGAARRDFTPPGA